jgi:hypothetical protein
MTINVHTMKIIRAATLYGVMFVSNVSITVTGSQSVGVESREKTKLF